MGETFFGDTSLIVLLVFLGIIAVLVLVIWSLRRARAPILNIEVDWPIDQLIPSLAGLSLGTPMPGNSVELLENGKFFDVLIDRIASAEKSVHFETFLWKDGELGRRLAKALAERARAGKQVRVMLDATGSKAAGKEVVRDMREAGCRVVFFHKRGWRNLGVLNDRDHRKMAIIDGREAFVGGHCIVDEWLGNAEDGQKYGDLSVRLHGPIVTTVQELAAAVQGIEAQMQGEFTVKPLQEHARDLDLYGVGTGVGAATGPAARDAVGGAA